MKRVMYYLGVLLVIIIGMSFIQSNNKEVTIIAVGDILLDRGVGAKIEEQGYGYPYAHVQTLLKEGDITTGNLEGPIYEGDHPVYKRPSLIFKGHLKNGRALKEAGFDLLNLANNHVMDYGVKGLKSTIETLKDQGIVTVGAGLNYEAARKPVLIKKKNVKLGFLSYSIFPPEGYVALPQKPDIARVDEKTIMEEVKMAKTQCDFLVLSFHWGNEYDPYPSEAQKNLAHKVIDSGADLVLGHHPHVLQGEEVYKGKHIFYSLGNFVFDRQIHKGTDDTIILKLTLKENRVVTIEKIPIKIIACQPTIVSP